MNAINTLSPNCNYTFKGGITPKDMGSAVFRQGIRTYHLQGGDSIPTEGFGILITGHCSQVVNHRAHLPSDVALSLALFVVTMVLMFLGIRYRLVTRAFRRSGCNYQLMSDGLHVDTSSGKKMVSLRTLFLSIICFTPVARSCVEVSNHNGVISTNMGHGDSICLSKGYYTLKTLEFEHPLLYMYDTTSWTHEHVFTWGCGGGSCPSIDDCNSINERTDTHSGLDDGYLTKHICTSFPRACAFSRGCWLGTSTVAWRGTRMGVYDLAPGRLSSTFVSSGVTCNSSVEADGSASPPKGFLVLNSDLSFLCPVVSAPGHPEAGKIGDLQLGAEPAFDWESVVCANDWFSEHSCVLRKPASLEESCVRLPGIYDGKYTSFSKGMVRVRSQEEALVVVSCNDSVRTLHSDCKDISIQIEGYRESDVGVSVVGTAVSDGGLDSVLVNLNCSVPVSIHLPCDGQPHYYPLTEVSECFGVSDKTHRLLHLTGIQVREHADSLIQTLVVHKSGIISSLGFGGMVVLGLGFLVLVKL